MSKFPITLMYMIESGFTHVIEDWSRSCKYFVLLVVKPTRVRHYIF